MGQQYLYYYQIWFVAHHMLAKPVVSFYKSEIPNKGHLDPWVFLYLIQPEYIALVTGQHCICVPYWLFGCTMQEIITAVLLDGAAFLYPADKKVTVYYFTIKELLYPTSTCPASVTLALHLIELYTCSMLKCRVAHLDKASTFFPTGRLAGSMRTARRIFR